MPKIINKLYVFVTKKTAMKLYSHILTNKLTSFVWVCGYSHFIELLVWVFWSNKKRHLPDRHNHFGRWNMFICHSSPLLLKLCLPLLLHYIVRLCSRRTRLWMLNARIASEIWEYWLYWYGKWEIFQLNTIQNSKILIVLLNVYYWKPTIKVGILWKVNIYYWKCFLCVYIPKL